MNFLNFFWTSSLWKKARILPPFSFLGKIYWKFDTFCKTRATNNKKKFLQRKSKYFCCAKNPYNFGKIFISLTTYPTRIESAYFSILSILNQTVKSNKIILTLIEDEFPNGEGEFPQKIQDLKEKGIEFLWAKENLRPHNKYFYSMQKYPDAIIITIDDDILYPKDTIAKLVASYQKFPNAISALHTDKFSIKNSQLDLYSKAIIGYKKDLFQPKLDLMAEGFAGVLYPPSILPKETYNIQLIKKCTPIADDIWLKCIELKNNIPVVCADNNHRIIVQVDVQDTALFKKNNLMKFNDEQLLAAQDTLNIRLENNE